MRLDDTIAAISTPLGTGGIGIVRVSGPEAFSIAEAVFQPRNSRSIRSHTIRYGRILDGQALADEVLVSFMRAPWTYTTQDVTEINCHGGIAAVRKVLSLVIQAGARLADPGEFTRRAFLNGRLDLSQAEAVMEIIYSKTERARQCAIRHLSGSLSNHVSAIREKILSLQARMEVAIDYPEYEDETLDACEKTRILSEIAADLRKLIASFERGRVFTQGIAAVIVGRPNVGKSSLLNALLHEDRAIVTDIPGTTRDVLTETIELSGVPLRMMDTAGIREPADALEKIGVEKSLECAGAADVILWVLDGSKKFLAEDRRVWQQIRDKKVIGIVNKSDLPARLSIEQLRLECVNTPFLSLSAKEMNGFETLAETLEQMFLGGEIQADEEETVTNLRHMNALEDTHKSILNALRGLASGVTDDLLSLDLTEAYISLGEILGLDVNDDLIEKIFSGFCIGK
ncbi:MAG: tRNA uridine-5-carboxymethylaminomethyl(34) synthesis GTPase MnmE [Clostridiales bacterium]|jgi:tRNA modification GTPase|nr:tRNA uridine-5-carboxymethylaminomethyl(34) synthesis GTPase MnmE [Clostridiales bacterium]